MQNSSGSAGLDLSSTTATILTPDMPVTLTPMGVAGPLPEGIVGLVLGRSSLSFQGILVVRGAVDSDYTVEIKVLVLLPTKTVQINEGQRIAQFLFLLSFTTFFLMGERYIISDGMLLYSPDEKVTNQMLQMRYNPGKGLGKDQQKIVSPLEVVPNKNREGLGYSNLS